MYESKEAEQIVARLTYDLQPGGVRVRAKAAACKVLIDEAIGLLLTHGDVIKAAGITITLSEVDAQIRVLAEHKTTGKSVLATAELSYNPLTDKLSSTGNSNPLSALMTAVAASVDGLVRSTS